MTVPQLMPWIGGATKFEAQILRACVPDRREHRVADH